MEVAPAQPEDDRAENEQRRLEGGDAPMTMTWTAIQPITPAPITRCPTSAHGRWRMAPTATTAGGIPITNKSAAPAEHR